MRTLTIRVPDEQYEAIVSQARSQNRSINYVVARMLDCALVPPEPETPVSPAPDTSPAPVEAHHRCPHLNVGICEECR